MNKINVLFSLLFDEDDYRGSLICIILISFVMVLFCLPLFYNISNISSDEAWLQVFSYHAFLRQGVLKFFRIPFWSPYFGGGFPFIGHPENPLFGPFSLMTLLFGEVLGLKLAILVTYIAASLGMFYLTRYVLKCSLMGSSFSSLIFTMNSNLPYHISTGSYCEINLYYFPLIMAFFLKSKEKPNCILLCALIFALLIFNGTGLCIIVMLLFLALFSLTDSIVIFKKTIKIKFCSLRNFAIMIPLILLLGAVRVFPSLELLSLNSRGFENYQQAAEGSLTLENFYYSLFPKAPYIGEKSCFPDGTFGVDSTMYFGFTPLLLFLLAFLFFWKKLFRYLILLLVFILLSFGKNSPLDLFKFLWRIPIFHSLHYPNKYFAFFCVFIISLSAGFIFSIFKKYKRQDAAVICLSAILVFSSIIHLYRTNRIYHEVAFTEKRPEFSYEHSFFHIFSITASPSIKSEYKYHRDGEKNSLLQYICVLKNIGLVNWHGNIYLAEIPEARYFVDLKTGKQAPNPNYKGEAYFLGKNDNLVKIGYFSPNELYLDVVVNKPDKLIINQNFHSAWQSNVGRVRNYEGLLSIDLKEGRYTVKLSYEPVLFYVGLIISASTLVIVYLIGKKIK